MRKLFCGIALTALLLTGCSSPRVLTYVDLLMTSDDGIWSSEVRLWEDGTFTGRYEDYFPDQNSWDYPDGTVYLCDFRGDFEDFRRVDENCWSILLDDCYADVPEGDSWIDGDRLCVASYPCGIADGGEFLVFGPDTWVDDLPDDLYSWWPGSLESNPPETLSCYCLYNVNEGMAFFSDWVY